MIKPRFNLEYSSIVDEYESVLVVWYLYCDDLIRWMGFLIFSRVVLGLVLEPYFVF